MIAAACIATIAYLKPSNETRIPVRETEPPLIAQQAEAAKPAVVTLAVSDDKGGDWYVIENHSGKCKPDEGPADMIKSLKTLGQPYEIKEDVVEGNRPMQVSLFLSDGVESGQMVYYRGKARCQAQADKRKQSTDSELNRYK